MCSSFYGSEKSSDLLSQKIDYFHIAWRKGAQNVWALPGNESLYLIADVLPVFDEICRRVRPIRFYFCSAQLRFSTAKICCKLRVNFAHVNSPEGPRPIMRFIVPFVI
jgi:hypothetical protein